MMEIALCVCSLAYRYSKHGCLSCCLRVLFYVGSTRLNVLDDAKGLRIGASAPNRMNEYRSVVPQQFVYRCGRNYTHTASEKDIHVSCPKCVLARIRKIHVRAHSLARSTFG
jgi:hypothetical protein